MLQLLLLLADVVQCSARDAGVRAIGRVKCRDDCVG